MTFSGVQARRSMEAGHRSEDGDGKGGRLTGRPTVQEFLRHHGWTFERQGMHVTYLRRAAGRSRATEAESPPPPLEGRGGPASVSNPEAPRGGPRLQLPNKVAGKRTSVKRRGRR